MKQELGTDKYNYREKKEKVAAYRTQVRAEVIDEIYEQILRKMIVEKKYRDPKYNAKQLAEDLQTNTRYISATINLRFQMNYSELISSYRVRDAVSILQDKRNKKMTMSEVAAAVGFTNRQSFYAAFYHLQGKTPKQYQEEFLEKIEAAKQAKKKKEE
jgi:AraC-like DNA-binding protein